jgi:hypothetical protein
MNENATEYFKYLHKLYMVEVRKFLNALKENAPRNELVSIRSNVKKLLTELRKNPPQQAD